jgi:aldehyde:ferredoxin oxidoreductase
MEKFWADFNSYPLLGDWRKYGTVMSIEPMAKGGLYPVRNYQQDFGTQVLKDFDINDMAGRVKIKDVACQSCPVGCKHHLRLFNPSGKDSEISVSCLNAVLMSLGTYMGISGWDNVLSLAELTTRFGLDLFDMGNIMAMAFELYEKGIIDRKTTDNLELTWGNMGAIKEVLRKTAYREGFGDILADGLAGAAGRIGKEALDYAMEIKGMGVIHDPRPRSDSTELFSQITNTRGHASNVSITITKRTADQVKRFCQRAGVPEGNIEKILDYPTGYNVARLTKWVEDMTTSLDCMGSCFFPFYQRFSLDVWGQVYSALTGIEADGKSLLASAQKVWDAKKALAEREGWTRAKDTLPKRLMTESVMVDDVVAPPFDKEKMDGLVSDYYEERGWDRNTGTVATARKMELGLPIS